MSDGGRTNMCKAVDIPGVAVRASYCSRICVGDSDDSDTEGGLGNVERVVMRPPGHSGKAKRGHLCFDSSFETGNLGRVDFITENEYDLFVRPDTCNPRIRFWFHFSVDNVQKDQRIIFNIVNLSKTKNLFQRGMTPVVKSSSRPKWQRLPVKQVYYYRSPEHSNNCVLSFAFAFDKEDEKYFFAMSFPYSYSRCMGLLRHLQEKRGDLFELEVAAKSVQGRDIVKVIIPKPEVKEEDAQSKSSTPKPPPEDSKPASPEQTNNGHAHVVILDENAEKAEEKEESLDTVNQEGTVEANGGEVSSRSKSRASSSDKAEAVPEAKTATVIIARTHPGEPNTSFIVQGILEFLTSDHSIAKELRKHVEFVIFPMLNPDGVFLGNSRSSLLGIDINRSWNSPVCGFVNELHCLREQINAVNENRKLDFVVDLYGSACLTGLYVQGNSFDSVYRFERHIVFPKLLAQNCPDFEQANAMYNADGDKDGTLRRFLCNQIGESTNVYSVEVSMFGFVTDDQTNPIRPYTEEDYLMHGRRICRSFWEYFKVTHAIPEAPVIFNPFAPNAPPSAPAGDIKESSFSMIRLRTISEQKDIFSSLESLEKGDDDEEDELTDDDEDPDGNAETTESGSSGSDEDNEAVDGDALDISTTRRRKKKRGKKSSDEVVSEEEADEYGEPRLNIITGLRNRPAMNGPSRMEVRGRTMPIAGKENRTVDVDDEKVVVYYNVDLAGGLVHRHRHPSDRSATRLPLSVQGFSSSAASRSDEATSLSSNGSIPSSMMPKKAVGGGGRILLGSSNGVLSHLANPDYVDLPSVTVKNVQILPANRDIKYPHELNHSPARSSRSSSPKKKSKLRRRKKKRHVTPTDVDDFNGDRPYF